MPKISGSGLKRIVVPRRLCTGPALISWVVDIATATRRPAEHGVASVAPYISFGASPRGPISVVAAARAMALLRGRDYVIVPDIEKENAFDEAVKGVDGVLHTASPFHVSTPHTRICPNHSKSTLS